MEIQCEHCQQVISLDGEFIMQDDMLFCDHYCIEEREKILTYETYDNNEVDRFKEMELQYV